MSEIVNSTYVTLDGVTEKRETWPDRGAFGPEDNKIQTDLVLGCSAAITGRRAGRPSTKLGDGQLGGSLARELGFTAVVTTMYRAAAGGALKEGVQ